MANSKKRCRHCKGYFEADSGVKVPIGFFCSMEHVIEHGRQKAQKARQKQNKKELHDYRERTKSASDWKKEAQKAFNAYIRFRDRNKTCICCGKMPEQKIGGTMDAGHYRSRGAAPHLAFHQWNCHAQTAFCNSFLSGNIVEYRKGLIDRIGLEKVEALENNNDIRRFDIDYYKRIKSIFTRKLRIKKKLNKGVDGG